MTRLFGGTVEKQNPRKGTETSTVSLLLYFIYGRTEKSSGIPALTTTVGGLIFEELIRKFNENNKEESGERRTSRDVVERMAALVKEALMK